MRKTVRIWLHGLVAAIISGGASAIVAGFSVNLVDPEHFNLLDHHSLLKLLYLMLVVFVVNGIFGACAYLTKSPLPQPEPEIVKQIARARGAGGL